MMVFKALFVFVLTYLLISTREVPGIKLDRPAGALLGAVLMVLLKVMTLEEAYRSIDFNTITLLLGMMILIAYLRMAGFFRFLSYWLLSHAKSPFHLLISLVFLSGILSALFVNDTICIMLTPLLLTITLIARLNPVPFLIALATSANIGSVMTLTGNPQNMLIGVFSGWHYGKFILYMLPVGLISLLINVLVIAFMFRKEIRWDAFDELHLISPRVSPRLLAKSLLVSVLVLVGFLAGFELPLVAIVGGVAIIILANKRPILAFRQVDWVLLLFFSGLFVVVEGVNKVGLVEIIHEKIHPLFGTSSTWQIISFSFFSVILSNLVSNVPFVMLAKDWIGKFINSQLMWLVLAMSSTFAGNLTIVGSVANMIVLELSKNVAPIGFWEYFRVGFPVTLLSTLAGILIFILYSRYLF
ncbi:MAG: anion transporter [Candidatus Hadarchaeum sp.]